MSYFWVSEPGINVRVEDSPWGYSPGRGRPLSFQISYRQRGSFEQDNKVFGIGANWSCSFRAFVCVKTNNQGVVGIRQHRGGAGLVGYVMNAHEYRTRRYPTLPNASTCVIEKPDGAKEIYDFPYTNSAGSVLLFLTERSDPAGNAVTFNYSYVGAAVRLNTIVDADGKTNNLYYNSDPYYSNRIDHITDPYGRTAYLQYNHYGVLTNVIDVQGLTSGFAYGTHGVSSMTTPYGTTSFEYGGPAVAEGDEYLLFSSYAGANRYVRVTLPNGGYELYVYRHDGSAVVTNSYSPPNTSLLTTNWFDNVNQSQANSFYWSSLQYAQLSTPTVDDLDSDDYAIARQRHWLLNPAGTQPHSTLSNERAPSPNGSTAGQVVWYDYAGKSGADRVGSSPFPLLVARELPNGETAFDYTQRNCPNDQFMRLI